jgi:hypothetical protein
MIRLQIVERHGADLYRSLVRAMRSGELRTFNVARRGRKVTHANPGYSGWINWSASGGAITCEVLSPRKPGTEWRLLSALVGRLADKYAEQVHSINVQFPAAPVARTTGRKRRKPRGRR